MMMRTSIGSFPERREGWKDIADAREGKKDIPGM
jgi:hypothetical protein